MGASLPLCALLACAALASAGAHAQLAPGRSGFSDSPIEATQGEYWHFVRELGGCLAGSKKDKAVALLATVPGSVEEQAAFRGLISRTGRNACMRNMVRAVVDVGQVRGAIAEGLFKRQANVAGQSAPTAMTAPDVVRSIHDFADCYVAGNYGAARDLLVDTRLGTQEEMARVKQMAPGFGPCLPQGQRMTIVPTNIRLALAGALYRATNGRAVARGLN